MTYSFLDKDGNVMVEPVSKSKADSAAKRIRKALASDQDPPDECLEIIDRWRIHHAEPLVEVTQSLRDRAARLRLKAPIAQRLKRKPQIIDKLRRSHIRLAQMQDVGGCRAVVPGPPEVAALGRSITTRPGKLVVRDEDDYTADGRPETGYRARHVIVDLAGRLIEIQLRTARQHAWAEGVERAATLTGHQLKDGQGPEDVVEFFRRASDAFCALDAGHEAATSERRILRKLRKRLEEHVMRASETTEAKLPARHHLMTRTNQWLIIYNWRKAKFEHWLDLGSSPAQAASRYARYEAQYRLEDGYEVVLVGADSEATIERTHAHYFGRSRGDIDPHGYFAEIL